jgi:hypothetical protein
VFHPRQIHRKAIVCGIVVTLVGTSSAAGQSQDLRSPDARDAARPAATAPAGQDLRTPDARDAARAPEIAQAKLRYYSSQPVAVAQPATVQHDSPWLTIALTIAATLVAVAIGSTSLRRLRIRRHRTVVAS